MMDITIDLEDDDIEIICKTYGEKWPNYKKYTANTIEDRQLYEIIKEGFNSVFSDFEEGGRWSNYQTNVYKITDDLYILIYKEVPATEMQDGGDFITEIYKVKPQETTTIEYVAV